MNEPAPDPLKTVQDTKDHLYRYLQQVADANKQVPNARQALQIAEWEIDALANRPDGSDSASFANLQAPLHQVNEFVKRVFPLAPSSTFSASLSTTVATSGNTAVYDYVSQNSAVDFDYTTKYTERYRELQATQQRPQHVRQLLLKLANSNTVERFDRAQAAYEAAQTPAGNRSNAATAIRTALDGVKGDLFNKARNTPKENMSWDVMASRLAEPGTAQQQLETHKETRSSLVADLSSILKDREGQNVRDLPDIWTRFLDHVYSVLGLIGLTP